MFNKIIKAGISLIMIIVLMVGCSQKEKQYETLLTEKDNININKAMEEKFEPEVASPEVPMETKVKKYTEARIRENREDKINNQDKKIVYLTFDDTMSENTVKILDSLKQNGIKATFFPNLDLRGQNIEFEKRMLKRMVEEGHSIGNHTASHSYAYVYSSIDNYIADTDKLNNFIYESVGVKPDIIRFPGGSNNQVSWRYGGKAFMKQLILRMKEEGYQYFDWNVSSSDAAAETVSKDVILKNVLNGAKGKNKAIVLMHESRAKTTTSEALPQIIKGLKSMGYEFEVLSKDSFTVQFIK